MKMKKHLIYHICPLLTNDGWLRNLDQLAKRWSVFDGTKTFAAVQSEECESLETVHIALASRGLTSNYAVLVFNNDKKLREVVTFLPLLKAVKVVCKPDDFVFYAHTKGNSTKDGVQGATRWRNMMYHWLLGRADDCCQRLTEGARMVGTNKMIWRPMPASTMHSEIRRLPRPVLCRTPFPSKLDNRWQWIFGGTFFWFRADAVFSNERWDFIPVDRYAAEAWPGQMFQHDECHSMFDPFSPRLAASPYDPKYYPKEFDDQ
jgi:hypothetical protein